MAVHAARSSSRPSCSTDRRVRFEQGATDTAEAAGGLTGTFKVSPLGDMGATLRPVPHYPNVARLNGLLNEPDATQRPFGVNVAPNPSERFALSQPTWVGTTPAIWVAAHGVTAVGVSLGPQVALSLEALAALLLPLPALGWLPKGVAAVLASLAFGLTPRAGYARYKMHGQVARLSPEALAEVARARQSLLRWLLVAINLDGLLPLPRALALPPPRLPGSGQAAARPTLAAPGPQRDAKLPRQHWPQVGASWGVQRASVREGGLGLVCGGGLAPGGALRTSWLRHNNVADNWQLARRQGHQLVLTQDEVVAQPWQAWFEDGLLWGTQHRGEGQQQIRRRVAQADIGSDRANTLAWRFQAALLAAPRPANETAGAAPWYDSERTQLTRVASEGAGWRWPWALPTAGRWGVKSLGVGRMRQRYVVEQWPGPEPPPIPQPAATGSAHHRHGLRLGVLAFDEGLAAGRVNWELELSWPDAETEQPNAFAEAALLHCRIYVPWLNEGRRAALLRTLGSSRFAAMPWPTATGHWHQDLLLDLTCRLSAADLRAGEAPRPTTATPWLNDAARHLTDWAAMLRQSIGLSPELPLSAPADAALLDLLAERGPAVVGLWDPPADRNTPDAARRACRIQVAYGQTQKLLQEAGWHLASWPRSVARPPRGWRRAAERLSRRLAREAQFLAGCPFTLAMAASDRARDRTALAELQAALLARLRAPALPEGGAPAEAAGPSLPALMLRVQRRAEATVQKHAAGSVLAVRGPAAIDWMDRLPRDWRARTEATPAAPTHAAQAPPVGPRPFFDRNAPNEP